MVLFSVLLSSGDSNVQTKNEDPSGSASVPPTSSPSLTRQEKRASEDKTSKVAASTDGFADGEAQEREAKPVDPRDGSSPSTSHPVGHVDGIVEKHLGDFSAEMQLFLQRESISYDFSASAQVTTASAAVQYSLPHRPMSQFSQYVSFYNPCPPVQDYVDSLQDNIESMLTELVNDWPGHKPTGGPKNVDAALAREVSAFVSSIRASREDLSDGDLLAADACHNPVPSKEGISKPIRCTDALEGDGILEQTCEGNFARVSGPATEPSLQPEPTSSRPHTPRLSSPPATALSSLINQLQPEVFHNLMDIIKDVKRNSVQFYLHSRDPGDRVYEDIKVCVRHQFEAHEVC